MKIGTWLLSLIEPMLAKVLVSLGFGVVSIIGVDAALNTLKSQLVAQINSMPGDWLAFALYLWIGKGLGIILGACATKLMLWSAQHATSIMSRSIG
ncbi:DUF2523 domain-containing protein [Pseudorhodoferax sp.]|uniref:DUF2523 domain-containing protein n=1 Tax=Pseudorhodoferax sp. TaxID=1993553 RepID=UPI0039E4008B